MTLAFDEGAFKTHLLHYMEVVACKTIGDSTQYSKHLQRRMTEGDAVAAAQTTAVQFFATLETQTQQVVQVISPR